MPASAAAQPYSYLHPPLGDLSSVSNLDPSPARPFGFGLSYTTFAYDDLAVAAPYVATDATIEVSVRVTNSGTRAGTDVVQLYAHDVVASITRPVSQLLGFQRVSLAPGESARVSFSVPTTRLAFSDRDFVRVVEPGRVELWVGTPSRWSSWSARLMPSPPDDP
jgi:beta-glucosidase